MSVCRICGATISCWHEAKEMMFGYRDVFKYGECRSCGCLQIDKYPDAMDKYYPDNYYSFSQSLPELKKNRWLRFILYLKFYARKLYFILNSDYYAPWPIRLNLSTENKVLEIGCGSGVELVNWYNLGLNHLLGIDKYIQKEFSHKDQLMIRNGDFYELQDQYNLVMMHHTLEHLPNQEKVFHKINQLLPEGGLFFFRIPVKSWAWEYYNVNWVQLDAPRHFYIHTEESIKILAKKFGFQLLEVVYDSWHLQFSGSEKYKSGISLHDVSQGKPSDIELKKYNEMAVKLNKERRGDQAAFILNKVKHIQ